MKNTKLSFLTLIFLLSFLFSPLPAIQAENKDYDLKELMSLPYLQGYFRAPEETNVTRYNRERVDKGYNLYASGHTASAYLIDMKGHLLHEWAYDINRIWPDSDGFEEGTTPFWEDVYLFENGDLLAIYHDGGIIKMDKNSNLLWSRKVKTHHAISLDENGNIYTLTEETVALRKDISVLDNAILMLSSDGTLIKKLSVLQMMKNSRNPAVQSVFQRVLGIALNGGEDIYHTNTLKILDGKLQSRNPVIFKKGNILLCMLTISTIAVIDPSIGEIVWILGPKIWFQGQHDPDFLDNGHILIFDNHFGGSKEQSRVMEFDPFTKEMFWEYKDKGFYTDTHGTNARLKNGNTLIVETNTGRAFEVTPDKKIVWEFLNPHTTGKNNDLIAAIFVMYRIPPSHVASWLK